MIYFNNNKIKWLILTAWGKSPGCFSRPANRYNRPSSWCHLILKKKNTHKNFKKVSHDMVFFFKYVKNNVVVSHFYKCFYKIYIQKNLLIMKLKKYYLTIRISITLWKISKNFNDFYKLERLISKKISPKSNNFNFDNGLRYLFLFFPTIDNLFL